MLWREVRVVLTVAMSLWVLFRLPARWIGWIDRILPDSFVGLLLMLFGAVFLVALCSWGREILAVVLRRGPFMGGDYDRALRRTRWLGLGFPSSTMLHGDGLVLALAGRPAEAERCYLRALEKMQGGPPARRIRLLACLGFALADLKRYREARQWHEAAIRLGDVTGNTHDGVAETYLLQGAQPQKALDWIERALKVVRASVPGLASTNWRIGTALLAMGETERAMDHFRTAANADPHGQYGKLALEQIQRR